MPKTWCCPRISLSLRRGSPVNDGVFSEDAEGLVQFHEATHLTASDWDQLQQTVRHRVLRYFHRCPALGGSPTAFTPETVKREVVPSSYSTAHIRRASFGRL